MRWLIVILSFLPLIGFAQFRGTADFVNFSVDANSRYVGQAINWLDHTNKGYYPTGLADTMFLVDANGNDYGIYSFSNPNFNSVDLIVEDLDTVGFAPFGRGMIYEGLYGGHEVKPIVPDNNEGVSPELRASLETNNFKVLGDTIDFVMSKLLDTMILKDDSLMLAYFNRDTTKIGLIKEQGFYQKFEILASGGDSVTVSENVPDSRRKMRVLRNGVEVENYVIEGLNIKFPYAFLAGELIEIFYL